MWICSVVALWIVVYLSRVSSSLRSIVSTVYRNSIYDSIETRFVCWSCGGRQGLIAPYSRVSPLWTQWHEPRSSTFMFVEFIEHGEGIGRWSLKGHVHLKVNVARLNVVQRDVGHCVGECSFFVLLQFGFCGIVLWKWCRQTTHILGPCRSVILRVASVDSRDEMALFK